MGDIQIFYATEDDPVFSDRLKLTKDEILSSDPAILNWKHIVKLPNDITGIRVDIVLADTVNLEDDVFPEVKLKLNRTRFYDDPKMAEKVIARKTEGNHYQFELGKKDVVRNRTSYAWRVLFTLFCIAASVFGALFSIGRGIVPHRRKDRPEQQPQLPAGAAVRAFPARVCPALFSLRGTMMIAFLLLCVFPVFKFNPDKVDEWENRTLESFPEHFSFNEASSYFAQVERCFNDRFFGRSFLIGLSDRISTTFNRRDSEKVSEGEDNWLFYYETLPETKLLNFRREHFSKAGDYINKLACYAAAHDKKFIYVICPDKFRIHGDRLTCYSSGFYLKNDIVDEFVEYLKNNYDFPIVYQRHELLQLKTDSGHDLFYRYDTHWTEEGAYYGLYLPVLNALSVAPAAIDGWTPGESREGDLIAFLSGEKNKKRTMPPHRFYEPSFRKNAAIRTVEDPHIPNPEYDIILSENPGGAPLNVLFLRDSFMNAGINIFANSFRQSVFIRRYRFYKSDLEYIDQSDVIVLEHVERLVYQLLWQDFNLEE